MTPFLRYVRSVTGPGECSDSRPAYVGVEYTAAFAGWERAGRASRMQAGFCRRRGEGEIGFVFLWGKDVDYALTPCFGFG